MDKLSILISKEDINKKVIEIADAIRTDYHDKEPLLLGILKSSFIFMADLVRALNMPVEIDFIKLSSYGSAKESSGQIKVIQGLRVPVRGRDVIIVDEIVIVDTGLTTKFFVDHLASKKPSSVKLCTLLTKQTKKSSKMSVDYLGFTIPDGFIVGYGLDYNEHYRYLPDLYTVKSSE
ncbi:MAG: hypoxanthine phosphoribosyltransferase [Chloroflexi bacterium]|nr:hypoxanthine phosphoribosyltransferase [Chloroflexota bacterium]